MNRRRRYVIGRQVQVLSRREAVPSRIETKSLIAPPSWFPDGNIDATRFR